MSTTTDRRVRCAELIAGGASVYDAMITAGFGQRFAAGNADTFAAFLAAKGFLQEKAAGRAKPGVAKPAPVQDEKE